MSFILDALKKSESDRQRQNGPALFEVKVAPPRTRLPLWAVAIAALLVVNLGIVMWMVLRHPARAAAEEAATGAAAAPAALATAPLPAGPAPVASAASAPAGPAEAMPAAAVSTTPAAAVSAATQTAAVSPSATAATSTTGGAGSAAEESNPEDYAPAHESAAAGLGNHVRRGTTDGVPLYQDAAATPGAQIPQLRLDLHAFAARPQDRFVLINMHKLREGDSLPEGVRVDSITPDGAILSYNGSRFLLPRE
jgi:general secretion pathway protein B